jgi:hypothetical protein
MRVNAGRWPDRRVAGADVAGGKSHLIWWMVAQAEII